MKILRGLFLLGSVLLLFISIGAQAQTSEKKRVSVTSTERFPFTSGELVFLKDSFGEVQVEGWERDEVEIIVTRSTQKEYLPPEQASETRRLDKIKIIAKKDVHGDLLIETKNLPFMMKNNLSLLYLIKVPQHIALRVKHSIGEVNLKNIIGSINATCSIGELSLQLPASEQYDVDMRAKIGDVNSAFGGDPKRQKLLGAKLLDEAKATEPHKLFLRVGIGDIQVSKMGN